MDVDFKGDSLMQKQGSRRLTQFAAISEQSFYPPMHPLALADPFKLLTNFAFANAALEIVKLINEVSPSAKIFCILSNL